MFTHETVINVFNIRLPKYIFSILEYIFSTCKIICTLYFHHLIKKLKEIVCFNLNGIFCYQGRFDKFDKKKIPHYLMILKPTQRNLKTLFAWGFCPNRVLFPTPLKTSQLLVKGYKFWLCSALTTIEQCAIPAVTWVNHL